MRLLATFDVCDNKRRREIVKLFLKYFQRVQKSVFEGHIDKSQYRKCREVSLKIIDEKVDSIRFYPICSTCSDGMFLQGASEVIEDYDFLII